MNIKVWVRDLTIDKDIAIMLPEGIKELDIDHEYIILDSESLSIPELENIDSLADFLKKCDELGVDKETLEILSATFMYNEIKEMVEKEELPTIIDFDAETSDWRCGNGGDFTSEFDKGMAVYDFGYYNPFKFEMTEDIYDWIDWESVWTNAETDGWRAVRVNRTGYLIHRIDRRK